MSNQLEVIQATTGSRQSLTPNLDKVFINLADKRSLSYAMARAAINEDFALNKRTLGESVAKRTRKTCKKTVSSILEGTLATNEKKQFILKFPDGSIARL